jgi:hypothetical protein
LNLRASRSLYRELEEWERLDDPEESLTMARVMDGARAGFHWMSLKKHKKIVTGGKRSERGLREANDHHLQRAPTRLPSASSSAGRLLLLFAMEFSGCTSTEGKSLDWQRLRRQKAW